jgi:hypothetical protein
MWYTGEWGSNNLPSKIISFVCFVEEQESSYCNSPNILLGVSQFSQVKVTVGSPWVVKTG